MFNLFAPEHLISPKGVDRALCAHLCLYLKRKENINFIHETSIL